MQETSASLDPGHSSAGLGVLASFMGTIHHRNEHVTSLVVFVTFPSAPGQAGQGALSATPASMVQSQSTGSTQSPSVTPEALVHPWARLWECSGQGKQQTRCPLQHCLVCLRGLNMLCESPSLGRALPNDKCPQAGSHV